MTAISKEWLCLPVSGDEEMVSQTFLFALAARSWQRERLIGVEPLCGAGSTRALSTLMTHQEKLERMYPHMKMLGVPASTAAPPAWRLLWRCGIEVPPPLFVAFVPGALGMGVFFGGFWGLAMWLMLWARQGMPIGMVAAFTLAAGALFGIFMAAYFRHVARKHRLPSWAEYAGAP